MKKRIPYTEPYTPEESAELAKSMDESRARMRANTVSVMKQALRCAWTDLEEFPANTISQSLIATAENPK